MTLASYSRLSEFQKKFYRYCVECDTEQSKYPMYHGFVSLCKEISGKDGGGATQRYNMRVWKDACSHWPRARWVCKRLFEDYGHILAGDIDLVLWGCGVGLDMLALYDQALQCDMPSIWTTIRSVTLIDENREYVSRAREIAEVLFPMARDRIVDHVCQLDDYMEVSLLSDILTKQLCNGFIPRLHILSHCVSSTKDPILISRAIKSAVERRSEKNKTYYNEIFVASAPGRDRIALCNKMKAFEKEWRDEVGVGHSNDIGHPSTGVYYTFFCITFNDHPLQMAFREDKPVLHEFRKIVNRKQNQREWFYMINELVRRRISNQYFTEVYCHVKEMELGKKTERVRCLYFAPDDGVEVRAFLVKLGKCKSDGGFEKWDIAESWLHKFASKSKNAAIHEMSEKLRRKKGQTVGTEYAKLMRFVRLISWDFESRQFVDFPGFDEDDSRPAEACDHSTMFGVSVSNVGNEVLPTALNKDQREIVYGRRRQRLVRGGPGTGKTLTMLHHAFIIYKRTHLPVLLVTKTNSLTGNNMRRFNASYFKQYFPNERFLSDETFSVVTINNLMCGLAMGIRSGVEDPKVCLRKHCRMCLGACTNTRDGVPIIPNRCSDCCNPDSARFAVGINNQYPDGSPVDRLEEKMKVLSAACDRCNEETHNEILSGDVRIPTDDDSLMKGIHLFRTWGGVLVDEAQLIDPEELKVVWRLTEHFNPFREFYIFADEEQSLHSDSLVRGANGKMSVALPGGLFGKWKTLKGNHRVRSRALLYVYRQLQEKMSEKYDLDELLMDMSDELLGDRQRPNVDRVFRVTWVAQPPCFDQLCQVLNEFTRWAQSETVTIIIDDEQVVRDFHDSALAKDWKLTHLPVIHNEGDRKAERRLKLDFQEIESSTHLTTIDCAQGRTFENVIFIVTRDASPDHMEEAFTGFTRASYHLQVIDASLTGWVSKMLGDGVMTQMPGANELEEPIL